MKREGESYKQMIIQAKLTWLERNNDYIVKGFKFDNVSNTEMLVIYHALNLLAHNDSAGQANKEYAEKIIEQIGKSIGGSNE